MRGLSEALRPGDMLLVDGDGGKITVNPDPDMVSAALGRTAEATEVGDRTLYPGQIRDALAGIPQAPANFRILQGSGDSLKLILQGLRSG